jgi:hypothetical protein
MATLAVGDLGTGGGFTATVTGGQAGDTHTLYRTLVSGLTGSLTWTSSGTRTGNGAITGTTSASAYYWWRLDSVPAAAPTTLEISNFVYQRTTSEDDACHDRILDAVKAVIDSLALTGLQETKVLDMTEQTRFARLAFPGCAVSAFALTETEVGGTHARDDIGYPVGIMLADRNGTEPTVSRRIKKWREDICDALRSQRIPGIPESMVTGIEPGAVLESNEGGTAALVSVTMARVVCRRGRGLFGEGALPEGAAEYWPGPMW